MAQQKQHSADLLIVILLFLIYAGCALLLSVLGANSYRQTVAVLQEGYSQRTGALYIAQKVHQSDIGGGVRVDYFNDINALVLTEQETGQEFETWIFISEGYLCELQIPSGTEIIVEQAQRITPMQDLSLELVDDQLLNVVLTTEAGTVHSLTLNIRSSGGRYNTGETPPKSPAVDAENEAMSGPTIMNPPANPPTDDPENQRAIPPAELPEDEAANPPATPPTEQITDQPPKPPAPEGGAS